MNLSAFSCAKSNVSIARTLSLITCKAEIVLPVIATAELYIHGKNALNESVRKNLNTNRLGLTLRLLHDKRTFKAVQLSRITTDTALGSCISRLQRGKLC